VSVDQVGSKDSDSVCLLFLFFRSLVSVDQVGSKDSDAAGRSARLHLERVSVDQVGSKDSDQRLYCQLPLYLVSVDQVGSKDSDILDGFCRLGFPGCPLIRLVPRTATRSTPLYHAPS